MRGCRMQRPRMIIGVVLVIAARVLSHRAELAISPGSTLHHKLDAYNQSAAQISEGSSRGSDFDEITGVSLSDPNASANLTMCQKPTEVQLQDHIPGYKDLSLSVRAVPSQRTGLQTRKTSLVLLMGVHTGIAHVVCANQFEYYANMMTGNTIRMATAVSRQDWNQVVYFATLVACYSSGASLFCAIDMTTRFAGNGASVGRRELLHSDATSITTLSRLAPISLLVFSLSDVVAWFLPSSWRLHCLAVGFGMINAATQDALGVVTNAATGHITRIGVGVVDALRSTGSRAESTVGLSGSREGTILSALFLVTMVSSIVTSSIVYQSATTEPHLAKMISYLPPIGTCFGILYGALLAWYTAPTPE